MPPYADTLTIESIPYEGRMCYKEVPTRNSSLITPHSSTITSPQSTMTEDEKRRTLQEVEQQQKDFGIQ